MPPRRCSRRARTHVSRRLALARRFTAYVCVYMDELSVSGEGRSCINELTRRPWFLTGCAHASHGVKLAEKFIRPHVSSTGPPSARPSTARARPAQSLNIASRGYGDQPDMFQTAPPRGAAPPAAGSPVPLSPHPPPTSRARPPSAAPHFHGGRPSTASASSGMDGVILLDSEARQGGGAGGPGSEAEPSAPYPVLAGSLASALSRLSRTRNGAR